VYAGVYLALTDGNPLRDANADCEFDDDPLAELLAYAVFDSKGDELLDALMIELVVCVRIGELDVLAHFVWVADLDGDGEYDGCCDTLGVDDAAPEGVCVLDAHRLITDEPDELLERIAVDD
jgi:hypothetical protein